jgi:hypothetical protein
MGNNNTMIRSCIKCGGSMQGETQYITKRVPLPLPVNSTANDLAGFIEAPEINDKKNMSKLTMPTYCSFAKAF